MRIQFLSLQKLLFRHDLHQVRYNLQLVKISQQKTVVTIIIRITTMFQVLTVITLTLGWQNVLLHMNLRIKATLWWSIFEMNNLIPHDHFLRWVISLLLLQLSLMLMKMDMSNVLTAVGSFSLEDWFCIWKVANQINHSNVWKKQQNHNNNKYLEMQLRNSSWFRITWDRWITTRFRIKQIK